MELLCEFLGAGDQGGGGLQRRCRGAIAHELAEQALPALVRRRGRDSRDRGLLRELCFLLAERDREAEAAEFVDQTARLGVGAGPDLALRRILDLVWRKAASARHLAGEVGINLVQPLLEPCPFFWRIVPVDA